MLRRLAYAPQASLKRQNYDAPDIINYLIARDFILLLAIVE